MFNDDEVEGVESGYIGLAHVAMAPLSQGKPINGTFQLKQVNEVEKSCSKSPHLMLS